MKIKKGDEYARQAYLNKDMTLFEFLSWVNAEIDKAGLDPHTVKIDYIDIRTPLRKSRANLFDYKVPEMAIEGNEISIIN